MFCFVPVSILGKTYGIIVTRAIVKKSKNVFILSKSYDMRGNILCATELRTRITTQYKNEYNCNRCIGGGSN